VAIDGPAGSGKSTTARRIARALGFRHLDTGAMYRAVTLKVLTTGINPHDRPALARLLAETRVDITWHDDNYRVWLDGRDVTEPIREPRVAELVSTVSALRPVRQKLVAEQRRIAQGKNIVCEGRDIGSVVFPDAPLKIYLDCAPRVRAQRRKKELAAKGLRLSHTRVLHNLMTRDRIDSRRRFSPLTRVKDAVLLDTTQLTIAEQVAVVGALVRQRRPATK